MADQALLVRTLSEFVHTMVREFDVSAVLHELTSRMRDVLDVDGAGVSVRDERGSPRDLAFVTATDEATAQVERAQIDAGEGPCHTAYRTGELVLAEDLTRAGERWPTFAPAAIEAGMVAVAGIPMHLGEQGVGAVNIYHRERIDWQADDIEAARLLADIATSYVINGRELAKARTVAEQLQHALDARVVIEQAKGILGERKGVDPDSAYELLRTHARARNEKVRAVAESLIAGKVEL